MVNTSLVSLVIMFVIRFISMLTNFVDVTVCCSLSLFVTNFVDDVYNSSAEPTNGMASFAAFTD